MQAKYVARCLSGRIKLPSQAAMQDDIAQYYARMQAAGVHPRYTHSQARQQVQQVLIWPSGAVWACY